MPSSTGDYYRRLRLPETASRREIKTAFRRLARQCHPDLHPNQPGLARQFQALREAYEVLIDRVQRQRYDQYRQGYGDKKFLTNPQTPSDFYIRGIRYAVSRRYRAALNDYNKAIELDEQFAEAYLRRAEARYLLEDDSGVLADCQRAITLNSTEAKTYYYQGLARYRLNYVQSAIAAFTDAITCDPEDAQYYYRRGIAHQDLHQLDEAAKDLRQAAQLYKTQGHLASYQQLQIYLRQFGTAGRSRPVKLLGAIASQFSKVIPGRARRTSIKGDLSQRRRASDLPLSQSPASQNSTIHPPVPPSQTNRRDASKPTSKDIAPQIKRPFSSSSHQTYWAPGVSSRPISNYRPRRGLHWRLFSGAGATLRLLSNPAGEMIPLYRRLSSRQASCVGYGLAVLANILFLTGAVQYAPNSSWLVVSWLWASGGMMFVAMVLAIALTRIWLQVRSLWVADIFILGTAVVPIGLLAAFSALAHELAGRLLVPSGIWIANAAILIAALWALSQSLITLYSGLSRIHAFPDKMAAWFTSVVLVIGLSVGIGTWGFLSVGV